MAQLETGDYGPYSPWSKMHRGHTRSWPHEDNDWARMELPASRPSPRHRRWDEIHRPAYSAYSAAPSSVAASRQRPAVTRCASVLLSSSSGMRHHSSDTPLLGRPPAVPSIPRASTAPTGKAAAFYQSYNPRSQSGSRRAASYRDLSPRSAHQYRSTPVSRRSMRSSRSESDDETDLTRPTPEEDDDKDEPTESVFVDKKALQDRLGGRRRSSQEFASSSSSKQKRKQKQKQKQKQTQKQDKKQQVEQDQYRDEDDSQEQSNLEKEQEQERESSILQQQDYQPQQTRDQRRQRSRRSSGSRGGGGTSSIRGRRHESVIPEEALVEEQQADADTEMGQDDLEEDRRQRQHQRTRASSRHTRRSISRHTTAAQDAHRNASRSKSRLRRADSDEFNPRASSRRPSKRYNETERPDDMYASGPAFLRRAQTHPTAPSHVTAPPSIDSTRRPASLFGEPLDSASHAIPQERSGKRNSCLSCMDEFPTSRLARLKCGHRMCTACLKKKFKASLNDPRQMPPRCCTAEAIAPRHVEKLFDDNFKHDWNTRFREFSLDSRMYCPSTKCGEWIKPDSRFREEGRDIALCERCRTKICGRCNGKWHASRECPLDERTFRFLDTLRAKGRQYCYKCKSEVECEEGRNHLVCPCGAESCMICGTKWRHCDCPVFDCDTPESDHNDYNQTQYAPSVIHHDRFASAPPAPPRNLHASNRSSERPYSAGGPMRSRAQSFEEKSRLRSRMDDYRAEELARRMESFGGLNNGEGEDEDDDEDDEDDDDNTRTEAYGRSMYWERQDHDRSRYPSRRRAEDDFSLRPRRRGSFADNGYEERAATDILPSVPQPPPAPPTPPQQQAQVQVQAQTHAPSVVHRYQHHQHQHHQPHELHLPRQEHYQYQQHVQQEQRQRQPPPLSQHPVTTDYYSGTTSRARGTPQVDSQVGRLADRFNKDSRSSPMHRPKVSSGMPVTPMATSMPMGIGGTPGGMSMGPLSPVGPMTHMPPMIAMAPAPPQPPPPGMAMPMMPMAPLAPAGHRSDMPIMSRLAMQEDPFVNSELGGMRSAEQVPFPDIGRYYGNGDGEVFASTGGINRRQRRRGEEPSQYQQQARMSEMAGLAGFGSGMDRVSEWMRFVGEESSEEGEDPSESVES